MSVGLEEQAPAFAGDLPVVAARPAATRYYLVVVARSQDGVFKHLRDRFRGDPKTTVVLDRRRTPRPVDDWRLRQRDDALAAHGAVVIRLDRPITDVGIDHFTGITGGQRMEENEALSERQRIDRWLEESQYLTGRLIPTFLDDRERLKAKLDSVEAEAERLRQELAETRRELGIAQGEVQFFKNEHAALADAFAGIMEHFGHVQKPLSDVYRRLQSPHAQPVG